MLALHLNTACHTVCTTWVWCQGLGSQLSLHSKILRLCPLEQVLMLLIYSGWSKCDSRRPLQETKQQFPGVDFSQIHSEEDTMWPHFNGCDNNGTCLDGGEPEAHVTERGIHFLHWLMTRYIFYSQQC